ncbi:hypothetical protein ACFFYR_25415 [Paraburkholderia dipogonis]
MQKVNFKNLNGQGITMAAVINFPADFDQARSTQPSSYPTRAAV